MVPTLVQNSQQLRLSVPDVSVVLCTYNGVKYLQEQLETILAQSLPPAEILISDDGSSDGTLELAHSLAAQTPVAIHIHQNTTRLGFAENFLQACDRAQGELIAFSDQDDVWAKDKLARQVVALTREDSLLCAHQVRKVDADGRPLEDERRRSTGTLVVTPRDAAPWGNFFGFTMVFPRSLLDRIPSADRGLDPHSRGAQLSHDRWLYFLASTFGNIVYLDEMLADYRQHGSQLYGGEQARSVSERLAEKARTGREQALYLAGVAQDRAALLAGLTDQDQTALAPVIARWRSIASHYERSAAIYDRRTLPGRVAVFAVNAVRGRYRSPRHNGLGLNKLLEDGSVAVLVRN